MFANTYQNKRVLVTGHTGFKGAWLTRWLLELGAGVVGISKDVPTQPSLFEVLGLAGRLRHIGADVREAGQVREIVAEVRPDFIFHLAAQSIVKKSFTAPLDTITTNLLGHVHLMEAVRSLDLRCVMVMVTSDKCYDNRESPLGYRETDPLGGDDPYSASKAAAELMVQAYHRSFFKDEKTGVRIATVRAGNVIGGGDWAEGRLVPDCIRAWNAGEPVRLRHPQATRPWQHVLEPLSGYLRLGQSLAEQPELSGEPFNFGPEATQNATVLDLLETLARYWDFQEKQERFIVEEDPGFKETELLKLNCDKALDLLGWRPVLGFGEAAAMTGDWYRHFYQNPDGNMEDFTLAQLHSYTKTAAGRGLDWALR